MAHCFRKFSTQSALLLMLPALVCVSAQTLAQTQAQTPSQTQAQAQARKDRVFVRDLEGFWINEQYVKALSANRSPHAVAKRTPPVVIGLRREGRAYPVVITDFNKAVLQTVLDLETTAKPNAYRLVLGAADKPVTSSDATYLPFEGVKNTQGKFDRLRFAESFFLKGKPADFMLLAGEVGPYVNRLVIAGIYKDAKGATWQFTEAGEARWPDSSFVYDLSLNDPAAGCEYFQTEDLKDGDQNKRFGYAWKGGKLSIFPARLAGKTVRCDASPIAVLTPQ